MVSPTGVAATPMVALQDRVNRPCTHDKTEMHVRLTISQFIPLLPSSLAILMQVADFGLSTQITQTETHVSSMFQGTLTHMVRRIVCSLSIIHSVKDTDTVL